MPVATLTVWKFQDPNGADQALTTLEQLQKEQLITVHDGAVVSWPADRKKPKTRQLHSTTAAGALGGSFWGLLFGLIFFIPLLGLAIGAATGALAGSLTDVGIDDNFIKQARDEITPGTSALFVMTSDAVVDKVRGRFTDTPGGPPQLIHTNLSEEQENALRQTFTEE
jgi:uncharacterized membrane protein